MTPSRRTVWISYLRVSTQEQADRELSLTAQRHAIADYAQRHGVAIAREFVEAGFSGSFVTSLLMAMGWHASYYQPCSLLGLQLVFGVWALINLLLVAGALRPNAERACLAFLIGAPIVLALAMAGLRSPWEQAGHLHVVYQGALAVVGFVLLSRRLFLPFAAYSAAVQIGWILATSPSAASTNSLLVTSVLPVLAAGGVLLLASVLLDQLRTRDEASRAELARHNERLEREVAERTAQVERQSEQLLQIRKLEAAGTLAAGVAHDFNNLLTVILGYCHELKDAAEEPQRVERASVVIERSARRAAELTQRLLGFARQGKAQDLPIDLFEAIESLNALTGRTMGEAIRVTCSFDPEARYVRGDPVQIDQVLLNFALNARDAMPAGGRLVYATAAVDLAESEAKALALPPGRYVSLTVRDTGGGIAPELQARVFDPFFSTRWQGGGHGLGLAMAYGIVRNHGGAIDFTSDPGRGTTFRVLLPPTTERPAKARTPVPPRGEARGMMLLFEDLDAIRTTAADLSAVFRSNDDRASPDVFARLRNRSGKVEMIVLDQPTNTVR